MYESRYARQVAKAIGIGLMTYSLDGEAFRRNLPRAILWIPELVSLQQLQ
jgi:hypothetical protein